MTAAKKRSIALTPAFAADIRKAIATGEYASTNEVIRDALRAWKQLFCGAESLGEPESRICGDSGLFAGDPLDPRTR
jgi:antitoxin ParD1/3/4